MHLSITLWILSSWSLFLLSLYSQFLKFRLFPTFWQLWLYVIISVACSFSSYFYDSMAVNGCFCIISVCCKTLTVIVGYLLWCRNNLMVTAHGQPSHFRIFTQLNITVVSSVRYGFSRSWPTFLKSVEFSLSIHTYITPPSFIQYHSINEILRQLSDKDQHLKKWIRNIINILLNRMKVTIDRNQSLYDNNYRWWYTLWVIKCGSKVFRCVAVWWMSEWEWRLGKWECGADDYYTARRRRLVSGNNALHVC